MKDVSTMPMTCSEDVFTIAIMVVNLHHALTTVIVDFRKGQLNSFSQTLHERSKIKNMVRVGVRVNINDPKLKIWLGLGLT